MTPKLANNAKVLQAAAIHTTYECYLDTLLQPDDLHFLSDLATARSAAENGVVRGAACVISRKNFHAAKALLRHNDDEDDQEHDNGVLAERELLQQRLRDEEGVGRSWLPLWQALLHRRRDNKRGRVATIVFVRVLNSTGEEVSGYVDWCHRSQELQLRELIEGRQWLVPRRGDLSVMHWSRFQVTPCDSPNFVVQCDLSSGGMYFQHRRDRKTVVPCGEAGTDAPAGSSKRTQLQLEREQRQSSEGPRLPPPVLLQAVLYDHRVRA